MKRVQHISLPAMARHLAANHTARAYELVDPSASLTTTDRYIEVLEDALRKDRIALRDDEFRRKYSGCLVYAK